MLARSPVNRSRYLAALALCSCTTATRAHPEPATPRRDPGSSSAAAEGQSSRVSPRRPIRPCAGAEDCGNGEWCVEFDRYGAEGEYWALCTTGCGSDGSCEDGYACDPTRFVGGRVEIVTGPDGLQRVTLADSGSPVCAPHRFGSVGEGGLCTGDEECNREAPYCAERCRAPCDADETCPSGQLCAALRHVDVSRMREARICIPAT